jgi:hypothetical protein
MKSLFLSLSTLLTLSFGAFADSQNADAVYPESTADQIISNSIKYSWKGVVPAYKCDEKELYLFTNSQGNSQWKITPGEEKISWPMIVVILSSFLAVFLIGLEKRWNSENRSLIITAFMLALAATWIAAFIFGIALHASLKNIISANLVGTLVSLFFAYTLDCTKEKNISVTMISLYSSCSFLFIAFLTKSWRPSVILALISMTIFFLTKTIKPKK